jgi:hypothetical protein
MKMRRFVTAESKSGVVVQATHLLESTSADLSTNVWGFDRLPNLSLTASRCSVNTTRRASSVRMAPSASTSFHFRGLTAVSTEALGRSSTA